MAGEALEFEKFVLTSAVADAALGTAIAVEATTGDKFTWTAPAPMVVKEIGIQATVPMNYDTLSTAAVVAFDKRVTYGSDTGRVELGRVTIPDAMPAGKVIALQIPHSAGSEDGEFSTGMQLVCEVVVQGAGGGSIAGDWQPYVNAIPSTRGENANDVNGVSVQMKSFDTTTTQV